MSRPKEFVAPEPTQTLHAVKNSVEVTTKLFGEITPARIAKERTELARRLDQLQPVVRPTDSDDYKSFRRFAGRDEAEDREGFEPRRSRQSRRARLTVEEDE